MCEKRIVIGTDQQGRQGYLPADGSGQLLIAGGSADEREEIVRRLALACAGAGVPVLATDTGGGLSGLSEAADCTLWDIFGLSGLPLRTTVTECGPLLLSKLLGLDTQTGELLHIIFQIADTHDLLLIDTKDLKALINEVMAHKETYERSVGTLDNAQLGRLLHAVSALEAKGAQQYLFEPAIDVRDLLRGRADAADAPGRIHILDAQEQASEESLYAVFLLFLLGELYEGLPGAASDRPAAQTDQAAGQTAGAAAPKDRSADAGSVPEDSPRLVILLQDAQLFFGQLDPTLTGKLRQILQGLAGQGVCVCFLAEDAAQLPKRLATAVPFLAQVVSGSCVCPADADSADACGMHGADPITLMKDTDHTRPLPARARAALLQADPLHEKYKIPFDRDSAYEFLQRRGLADTPPDNSRSAGGETGTAMTDTGEEAADAAGTDAAQTTGADTAKKQAGEITDTKQKESAQQADTAAMAKRAKSSAKSLGTTVAGTLGRQVGKSIGSSFGSFGETLGGNVGASLGRGIINTLFKS